MLFLPGVRYAVEPIFRSVTRAHMNIPSCRVNGDAKPFTMMHNTGFKGGLPTHCQDLMLQQLRFGSNDCKQGQQTQGIRCGSPSLQKNPCGKLKMKQNKKAKQEKVKSKGMNKASMWYVKDCLVKEKCDLPTRLDVLYYRSNVKKRQYQKTWTDCPRVIYKLKKICFNAQKTSAPKIERRTRPYNSQTAVVCQNVSPMDCGKKPKATANKCPRFVLPCCKQVRNPPFCDKTRALDQCVRRKPPYPSYSECKKDEIEAPPTNECNCLDPVALCHTWAEMRRRLVSGKPVSPKCGQY